MEISIALNAVLHDIKTAGELIVIGCWVIWPQIGHAPLTVLETLSGLPNAQFRSRQYRPLPGTGERPIPPFDRISGNPETIAMVLHVIASFA